jgi:predicted nucleotidyltransferase
VIVVDKPPRAPEASAWVFPLDSTEYRVNMQEIIRERLGHIEPQEDIKIFYACESGSRAWGFPSSDSDYDVRFLYIHPTEWYLSIENQRDVIEQPVSDQLDINGWDIRKALKLFRKSNPPLLEWLGSPIRYLERYTIVGNMREMAPVYYSPAACIYHYLHMAQGNYREYLKGEQVWVKKYLYVLRPLLAIRWIEQELGVVPMGFSVLVDRLVSSLTLREEIKKLLEAKRQGAELDSGPRIAPISEFIEGELSRLESIEVGSPRQTPPAEPLNELFRAALKDAW